MRGAPTKLMKNSRAGMTLVELLAALTLSSLLMAVVMGLVIRLSTTSTMLKTDKPFEPWKTALRQQLRNDYVGCRSILVSPKRILIDGYSNVLEPSGESRVGPCRIEYFVESDDQSHFLFRRQTNLLRTPPENTQAELVCRSVVGFHSITELSTDVAPGIMKLEVRLATDVSPAQSNQVELGDEYRRMRLTLVRHGGSFR